MPSRQAIETPWRVVGRHLKFLIHYLCLKKSKWAKELRSRMEIKYTRSWVHGELAKLKLLRLILAAPARWLPQLLRLLAASAIWLLRLGKAAALLGLRLSQFIAIAMLIRNWWSQPPSLKLAESGN